MALLMVLALLLAACATGTTAPAAGEPAGDATEAAATEEAATEEAAATEAATEAAGEAAAPIEGALQLMGWASSDAENVRLQEIIDQWNAANPDTQVQLNLVPDYDTKLQTALAGGSPPDLFYIDSFKLPDLVAAGAVAPIGDQLTDPDDFYPSMREAFTIDGTFYCPPKDFSTLALQYNKDLFDAAGVEYPTADWTWDDLRAAAEALTNPDTGTYGLVLSADFARLIAFLYQSGATITNEDFTAMTLDSEEARQAAEFYIGLVNDGFAAQPSDLDSGWPGEAFGKGQAAMALEGNWIVPFLADQFPDLNYGVVELPAGPGGKATMAFTVCYGVPANGANNEAAIRVVDYLTGPEGMKAWSDLGLAMPTRASLSAGWLEQYPDLQPFIAGADYAKKWQFRPGFQDVLDTINAGLQEAFTGNRTAEGVLEEAQEVGAEVLGQ
jgi:multiple sugar transport system substrate-binding protein